MLDQNTDRMWYVIGAVIVGAALIFLVNSSFPQLFASVTGIFEDKVEETSDVIQTIPTAVPNPNLIGPDDLKTIYSTVLDYDTSSDTWTLAVETATEARWGSNGLHIEKGRLNIPYGESLTISYEIYVPRDTANIHENNDINNRLVSDDVPITNDNDLSTERIFNGRSNTNVKGYYKGGEWNSTWFSYVNGDSYKNPNKYDLTDYSAFGIRNETGGKVTVKIRNIKAEYGKVPTAYVPK